MATGSSKADAGIAGKPTRFLMRLYEMVADPETNEAIRWNPEVPVDSEAGNGGTGVEVTGKRPCAFTVVDNILLEKQYLPQFYKHSNFTSFVRQLNQYQFRKVDSKQWSFGHQFFVRDRPDLLAKINRKRRPTEPKSWQVKVEEEVAPAKQSADAHIMPVQRQAALEACVTRIAEQLQQSLNTQAAMQRQIWDLTRRLEQHAGADWSAAFTVNAQPNSMQPNGMQPTTMQPTTMQPDPVQPNPMQPNAKRRRIKAE